MTNQQLLIGGALLWFWMQRDKGKAKTIIVTKSSTTPPATTTSKGAVDALRAGESLEQTREREQTKREAQYLDAAKSGVNTVVSAISRWTK